MHGAEAARHLGGMGGGIHQEAAVQEPPAIDADDATPPEDPVVLDTAALPMPLNNRESRRCIVVNSENMLPEELVRSAHQG